MGSKYSTFLTAMLVILIIVILAIGAVIGIRAFNKYTEEKEIDKKIAQHTSRPDTNITENNNTNGIYNSVSGNSTEGDSIANLLAGSEGGNSSSSPKLQYYKTYPMIGYIKISKTGIKYPILIDTSPGALDTAVCVMYPLNAELNKKGNVVIIGHNYRNGKFFSDNKKLITGDKIEITDLKGITLTYTIYEIFETTPNDTEYITRERGENIEISLSTCTDDGEGRLIILAKVE